MAGTPVDGGQRSADLRVADRGQPPRRIIGSGFTPARIRVTAQRE
jgi:hypothetical protein